MPMIKPNELTIKLRVIGGGNAELTYSEDLSHVPKPIRELTAKLVARHLGAEDYKWDGRTFTFTLVDREEKMALIALAELCGFAKPDQVRGLIDHLEKTGFIPFVDLSKAQDLVRGLQIPQGFKVNDLKEAIDNSTLQGKTSKSILEMMESLGIVTSSDDVSKLFSLFNNKKEGK